MSGTQAEVAKNHFGSSAAKGEFMFGRRGFIGMVVASLGMLMFGAADASAQNIRYYVFHSGNGGIYEIRDGSGTGGTFVNQPKSVAGISTKGYTDRASRGEYILVLVEGSGVAEYAGIKSDNNRLNSKVRNISLPQIAFARVFLDPNIDNVYLSAKMPYSAEVSRRLPIGTRPVGALR